MKYSFTIEDGHPFDGRQIRAMLMRGYHAFRQEVAAANHKRDMAPLDPSWSDTKELELIGESERFKQENRAWRNMLVSFRSDDGA